MKPAGNGFFFESFFGRILSPFEKFLRRTTAGGIVLLVTVVLSLAVANFEIGKHIFEVWETTLGIGIAHWRLEMTLHSWVNDGLMTLFFLLVGLELKRELMVGELSSPKEAALPVVAALGGMLVPALIYWMINPAGPAAKGWGIPMATDIAFAVGILVLLGRRIPPALVIFLTALAIADDLGAVAVIAVFYSGEIVSSALMGTAMALLLLFILNRGGIRHPLPYTVIGFFLWLSMLKSGVHPTIAGILLSCCIPARSSFTPPQFAGRIEQLQEEFQEESIDPYACDHAISCPRMARVAENLERAARAVQSPLQHLEHTLSPWVTFAILPIFAFSNLGIDFFEIGRHGGDSSIATGIILGLVVGKPVGITLFSLLAVKLRIGRLPKDVNWRHVFGVGCLGGIGFTMSIFISNLAFKDQGNLDDAKVGILAASVLAATLGLGLIYLGSRIDSSKARNRRG